ncbi:MAG: phosphotransferase [Anaerolineaceae bacterium]|nr:phosphotransferase [Anaerolineaceae bacterium]MDD4577360.1 phosphotransferase [Anaerolineaceae bacterium]
MERRTWEDTSSPWKRLWINRLGIDWFRVGAWLRAFHDTQTTYEKNDYFLRKKFEKFESHLNDLKHLFTADQVDKMNQIYDSAREYFNENSCEWVISHGDFGLDNIKKSGSMLEIIDFEDCQLAPREFDVLNCIIRMDYANWFLATRHSFDLITNQFLLGYRQNMEKTELSNFLSLLIKLDMLETYDRRKKTSHQMF